MGMEDRSSASVFTYAKTAFCCSYNPINPCLFFFPISSDPDPQYSPIWRFFQSVPDLAFGYGQRAGLSEMQNSRINFLASSSFRLDDVSKSLDLHPSGASFCRSLCAYEVALPPQPPLRRPAPWFREAAKLVHRRRRFVAMSEAYARSRSPRVVTQEAFCLSSSSVATVVVSSEMGKSRVMVLTVGSRAHHRWFRRRSYGARNGGQEPAFVIAPPILLAKGRPSFFLPAKLPDGRQYCFSAEFTAWCCGGLDGPSGLVPGGGEIGAAREQFRTRLRFPSVFWGPLYIFQGLGCNFCFVLGPVACFPVPYHHI